MNHKWENVEAGEWCQQCGTLRSALLQEFDPVTGADLGKFYTYFGVGTGERKVPEREGQRRCNVFPKHIEEAITQWMVLREKWGVSPGRSPYAMAADMGHSALLRRILSGEVIHPEPPPLSHAYPNYQLMDTGMDEPMSVYVCEPPHVFADKGPCALIEGYSWKILEKLGENEYIVTYWVTDAAQVREHQEKREPEPKMGWTKNPSKTRWHLQLVGTRIWVNQITGERLFRNKPSNNDPLWRMTRLPDAGVEP